MTVDNGDVLRATLEMNYENQGAIQNVFHVQNRGVAISESLALSDVIELLETIAATLATIIAVLQVVDGVRVVNVTKGTDVGFGTFSDATPFTGSGQVLPKQVALGVNLHTGVLNVRGRKYFGAGVVGAADSGGAVSPTALVVLANAGLDMVGLKTATNSTWRFGVIETATGLFQRFESVSVPTESVTQRRRRAGVGI